MTTTSQTPNPPDASAAAEAVQEVAAALDMLLTQAAIGPFRRFFPGQAGLRFVRALAREPGLLAQRGRALSGELGRIARGTSGVAPAARDRRFADPAWMANPALRRVVQAYLASGDALLHLVEDAAAGDDRADGAPLDWRDAERVRFAAANLVEALAPSNSALLSPVAWKAAIDTGGGSLLRGGRNLLADLRSAPRVPSMVPPDAYTVGTDLATTAGAVVLRTPLFELIQYQPATRKVRELPLLIVPPTINKYYILDLAPGRSMIEYLVRQGQQVFVMSWRNPDARHAAWGFDAYVEAIGAALDATAAIRAADAVHLLSACSGGILSAIAAAVRQASAARARPERSPGAPPAGVRIASLGLLVTMLDQHRSDAVGALVDGATADAAIAASARKGYLDGRRLAEAFAWLRPGDLIWNYWVNNYLQGRDPARFDILFWNADTTRMTASLHRDFVRAAVDNSLARPGGLTVAGTEIDLAQVDLDCYAVAGVADHICPWQSCYRGSQLLGGTTRFVLSTSGHIAALVNPVGTEAKPSKARFQVSEDVTADAEAWQRATPVQEGSWWPDYANWLAARSGAQVAAPRALGADGFRVLEAAPGSYVRAA
ncbi:MAG TPA: alpha/beta fold hydrolase [Trebonia sp.]|nr:alpha/beta fold hydrolase [Trebonia sp.]